MDTKKLLTAALAATLSINFLNAQVCPDEELAYKVKQEAFSNSKIVELSQFMTDVLGSRLAASQMKLRAEGLVIEQLAKYGLSDPRAEYACDFAKGGWDVEKTYAAMTYPYYCAFSVNPKAWSGSTKGLQKAEVVLFDPMDETDLKAYKGKLAGKIVLMPETQTYTMSFEPLATRLSDEDLKLYETDSRGDIRPRATYNYRRANQPLQRAMQEMIQKEKPVCVVTGRGVFNVPSATGVSYKAGDPEPVPEIIMPIEDHGRMVRMIEKGMKVEMEVELKNRFTDNQKINNVYAEIPGTDPALKDEIVMIGAHLDSWHGGTGGADNASGCIVMMEAMRILKAIGVQPKRTVRIALWGGEEQGLYGSAGYSNLNLYDKEKKVKLPGYDKFALYLNMDNGSGRFRGIHLERNDMAVPFFKAWMGPIESLGFNVLSPRTTGSTDHVTFDRIGLPAYQFLQDELEYDRTYHTIMDTYERLSLDDLRIDACITAWLVLCAANDPGRIPVKPVDLK